MSSLPPDIITSILIRLPVKSLLRFRSVSKPWRAQIDDEDFIKLHLNHSIATSSNLSLIVQCYGQLNFLYPDHLSYLHEIKTPFTYQRKTVLRSTCNGLLLLQYVSQLLGLFNPSTRKYFVLPTPHPDNGYVNMASGSNSLGYDVVNDDYKVFNVLELAGKANNSIAYEARVYSLNSNEWHIVKDFAEGFLFESPFEVYVHGALHTISGKDHRTIVALDVGRETCNLMPMPDFDFEDTKVLRFAAHVFDGCLALLCWNSSENRTDMWLMKEYGVKKSWSLLLSVKPKSHCFVIPTFYSKSRTEVLLSYYHDRLVWYDLGKKKNRVL